jgi:hypothetical protein
MIIVLPIIYLFLTSSCKTYKTDNILLGDRWPVGATMALDKYGYHIRAGVFKLIHLKLSIH